MTKLLFPEVFFVGTIQLSQPEYGTSLWQLFAFPEAPVTMGTSFWTCFEDSWRQLGKVSRKKVNARSNKCLSLDLARQNTVKSRTRRRIHCHMCLVKTFQSCYCKIMPNYPTCLPSRWLSRETFNRQFQVVWPSGLRRWIKAPVSQEAWVQIPPLPI